MTTFEKLSAINVNDRVEKKDGLTYLSWAWAWSEVKKAFPSATYHPGETTYDEVLGFMCHTSVTIDSETLPMWLPVMDSKNKSMKKYPYEYETRYGVKTVEAATTFDINKTIMRCLVKNLAMFGLGIYIYSGEDLPEAEAAAVAAKKQEAKKDSGELLELVRDSDNWRKVFAYVDANKTIGEKKILQQVGRKYNITDEIKQEILIIINS
jgi:hypothetical protein